MALVETLAQLLKLEGIQPGQGVVETEELQHRVETGRESSDLIESADPDCIIQIAVADLLGRARQL